MDVFQEAKETPSAVECEKKSRQLVVASMVDQRLSDPMGHLAAESMSAYRFLAIQIIFSRCELIISFVMNLCK